jgi:hypothetical protein
MKIERFPNGFIEFLDDRLTISGGEPQIIPRESVRSAVCRDGKKSIFSRNPPAVMEIEYAAGVGTNRVKLLLPIDQKEQALAALRAWELGT